MSVTCNGLCGLVNTPLDSTSKLGQSLTQSVLHWPTYNNHGANRQGKFNVTKCTHIIILFNGLFLYC